MSVLSQGIFRRYGFLFAPDEGGGGGGGGNTDQTDWKAKYEALNSQITSGEYVTKGAYVTLQKNLDAAVNERKVAQGDLGTTQAKLVLLGESEGALKTTISTLEANAVKLQSEVQEKAAKLERHNVIFKDFPGLAPFEADGLLPEPKGEQKLADILAAFQNKIGTISEQAKLDFKKGEHEKAPEKIVDPSVKTSAILFTEAKTLMSAGKVAEYDAKMTEYHAQKTKEQTS